MDEELLEDFLVEAGELIDALDGQLIDLESRPEDTELLNAVFRAFHTVKGGAGFLGLSPLVEVCHDAEEVLNALRGAHRALDAAAMDAILGALDDVRRMFGEIRAGRPPSPATPAVLAALRRTLADEHAVASVEAEFAAEEAGARGHQASPAARVLEQPRQTDPVEAAFEQMLAASAPPASPEAEAGGADDLITDDEFEDLLDQLQAAGKGSAATPPAEVKPEPPASPAPQPAPSTARAEAPSPTPGAAKGASSSASASEPVEATLRVASARIDGIMNQVGELVLVRNRLAALRARVGDEEVQRAFAQLNLVTSDLQASVMHLRMQSVGKVFGRFTRVVRDLARQLDKQVELVTEGESTELDKGMVESLVDPLVHLVRNAVDHGIESPAAREAVGKSACGRVTLSARQEGSHIVIIVADDGAGMDPERIRSKAIERGLIDSRTALQMPEEDVLQLIFMAGFSTRDAVSEVSGRGVGMDVVRSQIARINGQVHLQSESGGGSRVVIRLPLTLAILPTLMVVVDDRRFALPLPVVDEIIEFNRQERTVLDGQEVLSRRGEVLPLLDLYRWLKTDEPAPEDQSVVIATAGDRRVALVVDRLLGQEEVVIKSLGRRLEALPGFAGATITGDGDIALIIDVASLHAHWGALSDAAEVSLELVAPSVRVPAGV
ncbi:MAG: chemotaxis protein CheA [Gammaproteobacteria bacterium]|nr:chemotaxis protein CheA [Gammaproteobacteria bacterium]